MDVFNEIDRILLQYVQGKDISIEDDIVLQNWLSAGKGRREQIETLRNLPDNQLIELAKSYHDSDEKLWERIVSRIQMDGYWSRMTNSQVPIHQIVTSPIKRWSKAAVAAIFILVASAGAWMVAQLRRNPREQQRPVTVVMKQAGQPGSYRATLTLANGRILDLGSFQNGKLVNDGKTTISKVADGNLKYERSKIGEDGQGFNILNTPKAGQFSIWLPDGTQIWLNNASWLRYPLEFAGDVREVELMGEAYFEVAKDPRRPFRIKVYKLKRMSTVDVLGTALNVMAYEDEVTEAVTLVNGRVQVSQGDSKVLLRPEEQSNIDAQGKLSLIHQVNIDEITSWKKGYFHFDHTSLEMTMRQLARWYDVDVVYVGSVHAQSSTGKIQRELPLTAVLKGLESENTHFFLDGRKLIVKSQ